MAMPKLFTFADFEAIKSDLGSGTYGTVSKYKEKKTGIEYAIKQFKTNDKSNIDNDYIGRSTPFKHRAI